MPLADLNEVPRTEHEYDIQSPRQPTMPLTELQKMQAAYQHFTLEEWKFLTACVLEAAKNNKNGNMDKVKTLLAKFPSAVL